MILRYASIKRKIGKDCIVILSYWQRFLQVCLKMLVNVSNVNKYAVLCKQKRGQTGLQKICYDSI